MNGRMMNLIGEAIDLALNQGLVEIAIEYAKKPSFNETIQQKLWMKIALHLLSKGGSNVEEVLKIIDNDHQYIKIEDLLLQFNDNIKIEDFKEQICDSLSNYNA